MIEVLCHRVVWALAVLLVVTGVRGEWREVGAALRHRRALLVLSGPVQGGKTSSVQAGKNTFTVMTLGKNPPEPKADGDRLVVGAQTVSSDGETLRFGK